MPSIISTIIVATLLLLTPPAHALTPDQVDKGLVEGFTGHYPTHAGDYLVNTYCFCQDPAPGPTPPEAHYLQFEYYNFHQNMTFILHRLCETSSTADHITCIRTGTSIGMEIMKPGMMCRTWHYRYTTRPVYRTLPDELCYHTDEQNDYWRQFHMPGRDVIMFNGQKRNLDSLGYQGAMLRGKELAEIKCEKLCLEYTGMPVLKGDQRAQCKIVTWENLDDMCSDCQ